MMMTSAFSRIASRRAGRSSPFPVQVGVVQNNEVAEVAAANVAQVTADCRLPDRLAAALRDEQKDVLLLLHDEPFDQHQADEGLAETDAVAQERAAVLRRDLDQVLVAVLLVLVEHRIHLRDCTLPLAGGHLVAAQQLLQRLGVDLERRVLVDVTLDDPEDLGRDVFGSLPVLLVPLLEHGDLGAGDLDVQLDVLGQARIGEVRRADQSGGTDDFHPRVGDVRLGVELLLAVDTALDLAGLQRFDDLGHTVEKVVLLLCLLEAVVQRLLRERQGLGEHGARIAATLRRPSGCGSCRPSAIRR